MIGFKKFYYYCNFNLEVKVDLKVLQVFLENFNGKVFFLLYIVYLMFFLYLFIDVSNLVFGGIFGIKWFLEIFL